MHPRRIRARVADAEPIQAGYVAGRRLAFHKRGTDGSGKADAAFTGDLNDRVWGVVYSLPEWQKPILDRYESLGVGYDSESVRVETRQRTINASIYVARSEAIDPALNPFTWYLRFVLLGAITNKLPPDYVQSLREIDAELDQDRERHLQNIRLTHG